MVEIETSPHNFENNYVMVGFAERLNPNVVQNYKDAHNYTFYCWSGTYYAETRLEQPYFKRVKPGQKVRCYLNLDEGQIFFAIDGDRDLGPINVNADVVRDSRLFFTVHLHTHLDSMTIMQAPNPQEF